MRAPPPGFHTTAREPKRAHFRVPAFTNTTKKFNERTPRERKKERKLWREREKKSEILGGPAEGPSGGGVVPLGPSGWERSGVGAVVGWTGGWAPKGGALKGGTPNLERWGPEGWGPEGLG